MAFETSGRIPPLFLDLSKIITGEIDCSLENLEGYSTDGSPYHILPQAIIYPKNVTDIKHVLSFAREYSIPVTARGYGNGKQGGALGEGVLLDMSRYFNNIRQISMMDNLVTVDAGVSVSELADKLEGWGFELPPLLESEKKTTVGALFATRSVSPSTFFHGSIREWVESLTVVVDNGEEHKIADGVTPSGRLLGIYQSIFPLLSEHGAQIRASKPLTSEDATGYSIWSTSIGPRQLIDQLSGSEGTLGIITTITFRIIPKRPHAEATFIPINEEHLRTVVDIAKEHKAESLFLYDETFQNLCDRYHRALLPIFVESPYVLVVIHKDYDRMRLRNTVSSFMHDLPVEEHFIKNYSDDEKALRIMSSDFLHELVATYSKSSLLPSTVTEGTIVKTSEIRPYLSDIVDYIHGGGRTTLITGCIGSGHIAVTTLLDPYSRLYENDLLKHQEHVFSIVKKYKGGISASSSDGLTRSRYLSYCYGEAAQDIFIKIKMAWDPLSTLNPGKKTGVSSSYLSKHLYIPKPATGKP